MKEPMKEKDSPVLALSEKLNVDLMRLHGACNYCGDPSGRRGGGTSAVMIQSFQQKPLHNTGTKERVSAKSHCEAV